MKAEDVRYWLQVHSKCRFDGDEHAAEPEDFEWCMKDIDIVRFCDEIADAHEAELATAQAQMAVMAETLGRLPYRIARDALSAAPKVLHSEEAKWDTAYLVWPVVRLQRPLAPYAIDGDDVMPGVTFMGHGSERYEKFPGKKAHVIVLDKGEGE